jgi:hypothetical protein
MSPDFVGEADVDRLTPLAELWRAFGRVAQTRPIEQTS